MIDQRHRGQHPRATRVEPPVVVVAPRGREQIAGGDPIAGPHRQLEADRRIDHVVLGATAGAQHQRRHADAVGDDPLDVAGARGDDGHLAPGLRQHPRRVVAHRGIAALGRDHPAEHLERRAVVEGAADARGGRDGIGLDAAEHQHLGAEHHGQLAGVGRAAAAQALDRLGDLQRVADGRTELDRMADVDGAPVLDATTLFVTSFKQDTIAIDAPSGRPMWTREKGGAGGLGLASGSVLVSDPAGTVWALDKSTGAPLWSNPSLARRSLTAPAVQGDFAVVGDYDGYVHWLRLDNGEVAARQRVGGKMLRAQPVVADGIVIVQNVEGGLTAFRLQ